MMYTDCELGEARAFIRSNEIDAARLMSVIRCPWLAQRKNKQQHRQSEGFQ
jgi:hypothetical protein